MSFFKHISEDLMKLMKIDIVLILSGSGENYGYDICINNDNKTFNIIFNIVCISPDIHITNNTINIGKLIHVIPFNTLADITSGKLNDSYIIIETFEEFNTARKLFDYINKTIALNKKEYNRKLLNTHKIKEYPDSILLKGDLLFRNTDDDYPNIYNTNTNQKTKLFKKYFNAIPNNYNKVKDHKKLFNEMSRFILTNNIATIFNFLIHISPYKSFITHDLFNLNEKITYLKNRKDSKETDTRTVNEFDFDTSERFDVYNGGEDEDAYKMYFCSDKLKHSIDKSLLGEKLFNFFSEKNDKHIFVGFIMNYPKEWIPGIVKKFAHDGHMNTFIINKRYDNKIIIRFEPKGEESKYYCNIKESDIKQYIIDSLNEYKQKKSGNIDQQTYASTYRNHELNNNTASLIGHDPNNNTINNISNTVNTNQKENYIYSKQLKYMPRHTKNSVEGKLMASGDIGRELIAGENAIKAVEAFKSADVSNSNNESIKPTTKHQKTHFIPRNTINEVLKHESKDEDDYNTMINEYTYIDTANIKELRNFKDTTEEKSQSNVKNNYTIKSFKAPQKQFGDDYCQTYSLYGALLYCMNIEEALPHYTPPYQKAIHATIKLFEQITQTKEKVIKLQAFIKEKLKIFMPGLMNQAIEMVKLKDSKQSKDEKKGEYTNNINMGIISNTDDWSSHNNETEQLKESVHDKPIPIIKYTDEIKHIDTNLQKILDIINRELQNRSSSKNNRSVITKILRYYIDNLQTTKYNSKHNSQTNAKIKIQYEQKKKSLGIFSKSKIHETPEAQNYYKFLLEANFFSKIITLLNNHTDNERKQNMLLSFNDFLNNNPNYSIDMFKKASNEILTAIDNLKRMNNKTKKSIAHNNSKYKTHKNNTISNTVDINKVDIDTLNTEKQKTKIKEIIDTFLTYECNSNKIVLSVEDKDICEQISIHRRNLDYTYTDYLNSQKFLSKTKKNKKNLEQIYYRLLLECDLISQILSFDDKKIKLIKKVSMVKYLLDSIKNKPNYSISIFNNIKRDIISLVKSPHLNTKNNISGLLQKHRLI